MGIMVIM